MPLHHSAAIETLVLDDAPIEVRLAVLPPFGSSKEYNDVDSITKTIPWESGRFSLQAFFTCESAKSGARLSRWVDGRRRRLPVERRMGRRTRGPLCARRPGPPRPASAGVAGHVLRLRRRP